MAARTSARTPSRGGEHATDRAPRRGTLCVEAGLLAHGSVRLSGLPRANPSGADGPPLAAYSCGGSSGFTPASLLAPRHETTRRTSTAHVSPGRLPTVKWDIRICLYEDRGHVRVLRRCRVLFAPSGQDFRMSCEILDQPNRICRNREEGAAAGENLAGLGQAPVLRPARSFSTRDPERHYDEPRGQRSPGNPRQGFRQIVEFAFDHVCSSLR